MSAWLAWSDDWRLYDKVSFDGISKTIKVHSEVVSLDIRSDIYTSWIDWIALRDNSKFLPAIRTTGLDPIGPGVFTGDVYFLINGWKLSINLQQVKVTGVLYSDNFETAFFTNEMAAQFPVTVAALVNTVSSGSGSGGSSPTVTQIRQEIDANSTKLSSIQSSVSVLPTAAQNRVEIDNNSIKLEQIKALLNSMDIPTSQENSAAVWGAPITNMTDKNTAGGYISKVLLSIPKFLGLK